MEKSVFIYPWDLIDEGIETVLDRLQSHGINGLNISTTYHSGMFLMPHNPVRKLIFPQPGALYFQPDPGWHGKIKIEPPVSSIVPPDFWERLREQTSRRRMRLTSWTIGLHGSFIGSRYPETNAVNAFGDSNLTIPCAANDDVREYIVSLARDLAEQDRFDNILLESLECMPFRHGYHHEVVGIPLTPAIEFLLSLSFSEAMVGKAQDAGIDIDKVRRFVREACEAHFARPYEGVHLSWDQLRESADGEFGRYLAFRKSLLTSLVKEISEAVKGKSKLSVIDFGPVWYPMGPDGTGWESGLDLADYAPYIDEVYPTLYFNDTETLIAKANEYANLLAGAGNPLPMKPILRSILPQTVSKEQLDSQIRALRPSSEGISFYNYSFMPLENLQWIEDAFKDQG